MITLENDTVLKDFLANCSKNPHPKHTSAIDGRDVFLSRDDFGPFQGSRFIPALADFNLCYPGVGDNQGLYLPIQSHRYRAPEVIMGCPWTYSVDIWNLGLLVSASCTSAMRGKDSWLT